MIKTANYSHLDRVALRQKGWKLFASILFLQITILCIGYLFQTLN